MKEWKLIPGSYEIWKEWKVYIIMFNIRNPLVRSMIIRMSSIFSLQRMHLWLHTRSHLSMHILKHILRRLQYFALFIPVTSFPSSNTIKTKFDFRSFKILVKFNTGFILEFEFFFTLSVAFSIFTEMVWILPGMRIETIMLKTPHVKTVS